LTDGILIIRYLLGATGNALISNAIDSGATRTTPAAVIAFLNGFRPPLPAPSLSSNTALEQIAFTDVGTDPLLGATYNGVNPDLGEQDRLIGSADTDTFLLGDDVSVYQPDIITAALGFSEFPIVNDFGVGNFVDGMVGLSANDELIGTLLGIAPASLIRNSSTFAYV